MSSNTLRKVIQEKFTFWLEHNLDVLVSGGHGCGKTATMLAFFASNNLTLGKEIAYFSVGLGEFVGDVLQARVVYFDDLADEKAMRVASELIGLRLWKGEKVSAPVWGCLFETEPQENCGVDNPFAISVWLPNRPHPGNFSDFPESMSKAALEWHESIPSEEVRAMVSPRRLRLALDVLQAKGDIRDVLPMEANVSKLITTINLGPIAERLDELCKSNDTAQIKVFLANDNTMTSAMKYIVESDSLMAVFLPHLSNEQLASLMTTDDRIFRYIVTHLEVPVFKQVCDEIVKAGVAHRLVKKIRRCLQEQRRQ